MTSAAILDPRAAWLARRRELVTASDCAAILGVDERRGAFAVWAEKVGGVQAEETVPMARGRRFEDAIAQEYEAQTGRPVEMPGTGPYEITMHPDLPWLGATLDRLTYDATRTRAPEGPLQIKMAIGSAREWADEGWPVAYGVQVQIEIACFGATWGALAALVGPGPLKTVDLDRDDKFLAAAIPRLEEFHRLVMRREAPEADGLAGTTDALKALYAAETGETVRLGDDALALVEEMEAAKVQAAVEGGRVQAAENKLRARLGEASFGVLPDGSFLGLRVTKRGAYAVGPTSYRALRHFKPKVRRRA